MTEIPLINTNRIKLIIAVFVIVVFGSIILSALIYHGFKKDFRKDVENNLNAISNLKVAEIVQWRKERIGDGSVFHENQVFSDLVSHLIASPSDREVSDRLGEWFKQISSAYSYERVLLLDTAGQELLSEPLDTIRVPFHLIKDIKAVRKTHKVTFLDFHRNEPGGPVRLGILIPVQNRDNSGRIIALVVFVINPEVYLYPLINNWPTASTTAETLLLRREGDSVLFLNELKFLKNTALNLRFSINNTRLPAVSAALGNEGIFTGIDYRGVPVISSLSAIPESPWFMVTRMDIKEVFAPLRARWWTAFLIEALIILSFTSFIYALWRSHEITERKNAEEAFQILNKDLEQRVSVRTSQLEAANRELEAFSYSVSHDLRAPLRAVDGFSKFVLEDYGGKLDPEGIRMLGLIRSNTQKMDQLITDLLNLSRVSRREMQYSEIDMTQMAYSMFNESAPGALKGNINLKIDELPEAFADPVFIKQVWINLLSNAIKFTSKKKKPVIRISGRIDTPDIIYSIRDNGAGFNQQYVNKLFGVFQRLHKSEDFEGTGVGLAIVQRIIHRHCGKVWAEGVEEKGATFYFSLPMKNS